MIDLTGKVAIVTGGSRGIGRAVALSSAAQGADIAFLDRLACTGRGPHAGRRRGARPALPSSSAATSPIPAACAALVEATLKEFGQVDILVNNAGITRDDLVMRMTDEAWHDVLNVNLSGAFY